MEFETRILVKIEIRGKRCTTKRRVSFLDGRAQVISMDGVIQYYKWCCRWRKSGEEELEAIYHSSSPCGVNPSSHTSDLFPSSA